MADLGDITSKIDQARQAGYDDKTIVDYLSQKDDRFKTARSAGYADSDIISHFKAPAKPAPAPAPRDNGPVQALKDAGEAALTLGSGIVGQVQGGYRGLATAASSLAQGKGIDASMVAGAEKSKEVADATTYRGDPTNPYLQAAGRLGDALGVPGQAAGNATLEATGSPALATVAQTGIDVITGILTGGAPRAAGQVMKAVGQAGSAAKGAALAPLIEKAGGTSALADQIRAKADAIKTAGPTKDNLNTLADTIGGAPPKEAAEALANFIQKNGDTGTTAGTNSTRSAVRRTTDEVYRDRPRLADMAGQAAGEAAEGVASVKHSVIRKGVEVVNDKLGWGMTDAAIDGATKALKFTGYGASFLGGGVPGITALAAAEALASLAGKISTMAPQMGASMLVRRAKQISAQRTAGTPRLADALPQSVGEGAAGVVTTKGITAADVGGQQ
jgi:hypothetical protein